MIIYISNIVYYAYHVQIHRCFGRVCCQSQKISKRLRSCCLTSSTKLLMSEAADDSCRAFNLMGFRLQMVTAGNSRWMLVLKSTLVSVGFPLNFWMARAICHNITPRIDGMLSVRDKPLWGDSGSNCRLSLLWVCDITTVSESVHFHATWLTITTWIKLPGK